MNIHWMHGLLANKLAPTGYSEPQKELRLDLNPGRSHGMFIAGES